MMGSDRHDRGFVVVTGTSTGIGACDRTPSRRRGVPRHRRRSARGRRRCAAGAGPGAADAGDRRGHRRGDDRGRCGHGRRSSSANAVWPASSTTPASACRRRSSSSRWPTSDRQLEVNLFGPVAMIQAFLPLIRRGAGRIVNVGSIGGMLVLPLNGAYSASKFGMRAISDALRLELRQWNIHVSLIEVAPVKTAIFGKTFAELDGLESTLGAEGFGALRAADRGDPQGGREGGGRRGSAARDRGGDLRRPDLGQAEDEVPGRPRREGRPPWRRLFRIERATGRSFTSSDTPTPSSAAPGFGEERRHREHRDETEGPRRLLQPHQAVRTGRRGDGAGLDRAGVRRDEGADRVHRRTVGAEALAVPDEAPDSPDREHPARAAPPQDGRDPHSTGGGGGRLRPGAARLSNLVVPDEHADPLVPRVAGRPSGAGRQAVRVRVDLPPLLQHQPQAAEEDWARRTADGSSTRPTSSSPEARSSRCSRGSGT